MDKVNQKMRRFNLRGVLIGLRASVGSSPQKTDVGVEETLRSEHFQVAKVGWMHKGVRAVRRLDAGWFETC